MSDMGQEEESSCTAIVVYQTGSRNTLTVLFTELLKSVEITSHRRDFEESLRIAFSFVLRQHFSAESFKRAHKHPVCLHNKSLME